MTDEEREERIFLAAEEVRRAIEELFDLCFRDDGRAAAMMVDAAVFFTARLYMRIAANLATCLGYTDQNSEKPSSSVSISTLFSYPPVRWWGRVQASTPLPPLRDFSLSGG